MKTQQPNTYFFYDILSIPYRRALNHILIGLLLLCLNQHGKSQIDISRSYDIDTLQEMLIKAREKQSKNDLADIYYLLAEIQEKEKFNTELAFELYLRSKQYYEAVGDGMQANKIKTYIAQRYHTSGFINESLELLDEVLEYYQSIDNDSLEAHTNYLLSKVYTTKGDTEASLRYLNDAIKINRRLKDTTLLVSIYLDKVKNYMQLNEIDSALITSNIAFDISRKHGNKRHMAQSLYYIGYINMRDRNIKRAIKYLEKAKDIIPTTPYDEVRRKIYNDLAESYELQKEFDKSYYYAKKYILLNDSILNHDRVRAINNLSIKHQSYEKNKEIQLLEKEKQSVLQKSTMQRNALYFVAAGFGLLLIALYYIIRFYTQQMRTEKIINEQQHKIDQQKIKELEDTMQINNMQSMIEGQERERERIAKDLHDSLGGLLSTVKLQFDQVKPNTYEPSANQQYGKAAGLLDKAVEEVRVISRNLQPSALSKLGLVPAINDLVNRFETEDAPQIYFQHYNLPERISEMVALNIYRIIQELLNNSIKYAEASEILIQLNYEDDDLYVQYEDDGNGFDMDRLEKRGMGLDNIESRIKYLKGQISIETNPGEGVSFLIKIPYYPEVKGEDK